MSTAQRFSKLEVWILKLKESENYEVRGFKTPEYVLQR